MDYKEIKSFEDACTHLGISTQLPDVRTFPEEMQLNTIARYKLITIIKAVNNGWEANFNDYKQRKWFLWFYHGATSGFGSAYSYLSPATAYTHFGSRLCLESKEKCEHVGSDLFNDLWNDYLLK